MWWWCVFKQPKESVKVVDKAFVERVVEETGLADTRSSKMGTDEFLKVLATFNAHDLHFTA